MKRTTDPTNLDSYFKPSIIIKNIYVYSYLYIEIINVFFYRNFGNDEIVLNILKRVKQICENVTELGIGFESWGYDNPDITNTSTQYIVELLSQFTELNSLEISIFE